MHSFLAWNSKSHLKILDLLWIIELLVDVQVLQCKLLINVQDNKDKIDDIRDDAGIVTYYVIADREKYFPNELKP